MVHLIIEGVVGLDTVPTPESEAVLRTHSNNPAEAALLAGDQNSSASGDEMDHLGFVKTASNGRERPRFLIIPLTMCVWPLPWQQPPEV